MHPPGNTPPPVRLSLETSDPSRKTCLGLTETHQQPPPQRAHRCYIDADRRFRDVGMPPAATDSGNAHESQHHTTCACTASACLSSSPCTSSILCFGRCEAILQTHAHTRAHTPLQIRCGDDATYRIHPLLRAAGPLAPTTQSFLFENFETEMGRSQQRVRQWLCIGGLTTRLLG